MAKRKITILVEGDDLDWFTETYPNASGSFSWLFTLMLKEFRRAHSVTPHDYVTIGALALKKQLEES